LRLARLGQLGGCLLARLVQGCVSSSAPGLQSRLSVGLDLGTLDRGLAEGAQDTSLLLDEIRFGHGGTPLRRISGMNGFGMSA
jgi:hypothetical protein